MYNNHNQYFNTPTSQEEVEQTVNSNSLMTYTILILGLVIIGISIN